MERPWRSLVKVVKMGGRTRQYGSTRALLRQIWSNVFVTCRAAAIPRTRAPPRPNRRSGTSSPSIGVGSVSVASASATDNMMQSLVARVQAIVHFFRLHQREPERNQVRFPFFASPCTNLFSFARTPACPCTPCTPSTPPSPTAAAADDTNRRRRRRRLRHSENAGGLGMGCSDSWACMVTVLTG